MLHLSALALSAIEAAESFTVILVPYVRMTRLSALIAGHDYVLIG